MTRGDIISIILASGFIFSFVFLIFYGLTAFSYQKIFKAYGYQHPGYAWIPFYRLYILADLTCGDVFKLGEFEIEKKIFLWWWIITYVIAFIPFVGSLISFILNVLCLGYCHHEGIKKVDPTYDSVVLSYLSSLLPLILWILVLPKRVD